MKRYYKGLNYASKSLVARLEKGISLKDPSDVNEYLPENPLTEEKLNKIFSFFKTHFP